MNRNEQLKKLKEISQWDIIIIGGGASGLGSAVDAASRGYNVLLLEAKDFAKGTSSRSTKLVHGGVRYLAQGDVALVREALKERGLLAKNAAHLVKNQTFIIPNYSLWEGFMYRAGLGVYSLLSGNLSLGKTIFLSKSKTLEKLSAIKSEKLVGGVLYHDGQFDDARLAVNLAQTATEKGACVLNHIKVVNLLKNSEGKLSGVVAKDELSGEEISLQCKVVINATGVFVNDILQMDHPTKKNSIVPSQGVHIVIDRSFFPGNDALMIPKTTDGRVLFAVPWHNKLVVGTTDTLVKDASFEPRALHEEIDFIFKNLSQYLTKAPSKADVLSVFAGLRPLAAPEKEGQKTKEVSRSHKIISSPTGLISIIGGKWTTYRKMAEDIIDEAIKMQLLPAKACVTEQLSLHGNISPEKANFSDPRYAYGSDMDSILKLEQENPTFSEKIHPRYEYTVAQIIWAVRNEMAQTVEDMLARRVRLLFLDARACIEAAPKVAALMANELGKDKNWETQQTEEFTQLAKGYLL